MAPGWVFFHGPVFLIESEHCFCEKVKNKSMTLWCPVGRGLGVLVLKFDARIEQKNAMVLK
jgi:hypothetical protein